jgi:hypothetical protein
VQCNGVENVSERCSAFRQVEVPIYDLNFVDRMNTVLRPLSTECQLQTRNNYAALEQQDMLPYGERLDCCRHCLVSQSIKTTLAFGELWEPQTPVLFVFSKSPPRHPSLLPLLAPCKAQPP